eukprot:scaffold5684_cov169-Amphora_coffeaeformis.AAC.19
MTLDSDVSFLLGEASSGAGSSSLGQQPPPMVCIPGGPSLRESSLMQREDSPFEMVSTPTTSVAEKHSSGEEKVGRWTEEEHEVFLEGLKLHGKQWKTIATMIGTRTVVQVRTHAQKYFQKMERKNRDVSSASSSQGGKKAGKRKSLPSAMPSRKKPKSPKKTTLSRSASLSMSALNAPPMLPNPLTSATSSMSISSENLSTDSPVGVIDMEPTVFNMGLNAAFKDEQLLMEVPFSEDPLEWLLDGDIQSQLPESSIEQAPMFPDFGEQQQVEDNGALTLQVHSHNFDASLHESIMDPKLTVQSLFLDNAEEMAY